LQTKREPETEYTLTLCGLYTGGSTKLFLTFGLR